MIRYALLAIFLTAVSASVVPHHARNSSSCAERCGTGLDPDAPCQCNTSCQNFGDCCEDYIELCIGSCAARCDAGDVPGAICQCSKGCFADKNCCPDFHELCGVSNDQLFELTEELIALDVNNVAHCVTVHLNATPLLVVDPAAYQVSTIAKMIALFDNYIPNASIPEFVTPEELTEENDFINAVFATPVMQRAQAFLDENGYQSGRSHFSRIWFGLFNRGGGYLSSNGFEHVFAGELYNNGVQGLHNWVFYDLEEAAGNLTSGTVAANFLDFGKGYIMETNNFAWHGLRKPIGGGFVGTSPEFELAIYTVCWNVRPEVSCPIRLNGWELKIQTYPTTPTHSNVTLFVSTAYTDLSK